MVNPAGQALAVVDRDQGAESDEVEISVAAICAYGRLLRAVGRGMRTHSAGDGGLICEDRTVRSMPVMWRISPEGAVLPDHPFSFITRSFITAKLPRELATQ